MFYAVGTTGSHTVIPSEWTELAKSLQEYSVEARVWGLRVIATFNHSAAQVVSDALNLATPLVPTGSADGARAMLVKWLASPELSMEEKEAVAATPGIDFGAHQTDRFVRFAYTRSLADLEEAAVRIRRFAASLPSA